MADVKPDPEDGFREALKDVVMVLQRLSPHCRSLADAVSVCQVALENDSQLRLLMSLSMQKK